MSDLSKMGQHLQDYIRRGTDDDSLMQKYGACYEELETLLSDLVQAGSLDRWMNSICNLVARERERGVLWKTFVRECDGQPPKRNTARSPRISRSPDAPS